MMTQTRDRNDKECLHVYQSLSLDTHACAIKMNSHIKTSKQNRTLKTGENDFSSFCRVC